jgi:hypothetical protein
MSAKSGDAGATRSRSVLCRCHHCCSARPHSTWETLPTDSVFRPRPPAHFERIYARLLRELTCPPRYLSYTARSVGILPPANGFFQLEITIVATPDPEGIQVPQRAEPATVHHHALIAVGQVATNRSKTMLPPLQIRTHLLKPDVASSKRQTPCGCLCRG